MIPDKPHYPHPGIRHPGQLAEKTDISTRNDSAVFKPVIENIAEEKQIFRPPLYTAQKGAQPLLVGAAVADIRRTKMDVAQKITQIPVGGAHSSPSSSLASSLIMS